MSDNGWITGLAAVSHNASGKCKRCGVDMERLIVPEYPTISITPPYCDGCVSKMLAEQVSARLDGVMRGFRSHSRAGKARWQKALALQGEIDPGEYRALAQIMEGAQRNAWIFGPLDSGKTSTALLFAHQEALRCAQDGIKYQVAYATEREVFGALAGDMPELLALITSERTLVLDDCGTMQTITGRMARAWQDMIIARLQDTGKRTIFCSPHQITHLYQGICTSFGLPHTPEHWRDPALFQEVLKHVGPRGVVHLSQAHSTRQQDIDAFAAQMNEGQQ